VCVHAAVLRIRTRYPETASRFETDPVSCGFMFVVSAGREGHHSRMRYPYTLLVASLFLGACSTSTGRQGPALPSSSGQTAYSMRYADELAASTKALNDAQAREKTLSAGFAAHIDELKKTDWEKVQVVIDDSDEAGKSTGFADAHGDLDAVRSFWETDKDTITAKVAGGAQRASKEAGCTGDVSGAVGYALNDAINKQMQKRLRAKNEAFILLDRHKTALGPQNVPTLEKLADEVSEASYDVHVLMIVQRDRLRRLTNDKDEVKKTLDRFVEEEKAFQAEAGRTEADKKASSDRITAANKTKADVDTAATQAVAVTKQVDTVIQASTKDYEEALKSLRTKVAERKKTEAPPKT
jgi:hypothetical protein